MRCLWLTLADPEPQHNGQFVYSGGLINAFAQAGADVDVLGLRRPESCRRSGVQGGRLRWWLAEHRPLSRWSSVTSPFPHIAHRCHTPGMRRMLDELLAGEAWDSIIFDGLSVGWALGPIQRRYVSAKGRPKLVYISHNHEESLRRQIAQNQDRFLKRQAARLDAMKVSRLERLLVDRVDLVTAITQEDRALYRDRRPGKRFDVLTPGYEGQHVPDRLITPSLPRRAILVGSFDWIAKRMNLEEFVHAADPLFAARGAELQVIGSADESFLGPLRRKVRATSFTGTVKSVTQYMSEARLAIVPERTGGGFKLKVLDYIFNHLPILALGGSVAGVPLRDNESILTFPDHDALARGVLQAMDDVALLNRLQTSAYAACRDKFAWAQRGRQLMGAIGAL